ncbi:hypothetical protein BKP37_12725 [Anaerobacillus alkalilacustris]|uniref:Phage gp6-like head-tail connector protein n=1 Tax=Anaerobacillus alkalilacustris TaxID=393763 RepID=A0A1S2LKE1_9BACI|nr:hypothetical protein [Anaerobacillus alkalilacustris]OIJ12660.1 hypothetical protein BKP37_12725 [Anaerobacillus alkalilacustris]
MTDEELIEECKIGLNISLTNTSLDKILNQKILAVKSFMRIAGVTEAQMEDDLAVGVIVMGVADIWELEGGKAKFSPVFKTLLTQLTYASEVE